MSRKHSTHRQIWFNSASTFSKPFSPLIVDSLTTLFQSRILYSLLIGGLQCLYRLVFQHLASSLPLVAQLIQLTDIILPQLLADSDPLNPDSESSNSDPSDRDLLDNRDPLESENESSDSGSGKGIDEIVNGICRMICQLKLAKVSDGL